MDRFLRSQMLVGKTAVQKLNDSHVAVFGVGGVGGFCVEALARSGVGTITLFDNDVVSQSNINRQIVALDQTVGKSKIEVMRERILGINPNARVICHQTFYLPENAENYPFNQYHFVIDAVDTVTAKIEIIKNAKELGVGVISCMGTGGKLCPEKLAILDIEKTSVCPLARVMRRELKNRNIKGVPVVYSTEESVSANQDGERTEFKSEGRVAPSSMIFVPATAGIMLANYAVKYLMEKN